MTTAYHHYTPHAGTVELRMDLVGRPLAVLLPEQATAA